MYNCFNVLKFQFEKKSSVQHNLILWPICNQFPQYYGQYTTCEHKGNSVDDDHCGFSLANDKSTEEWLLCPIWMIWFSNDYQYHVSIFLYLIKLSLTFFEDLVSESEIMSDGKFKMHATIPTEKIN